MTTERGNGVGSYNKIAGRLNDDIDQILKMEDIWVGREWKENFFSFERSELRFQGGICFRK